MPSGLEVYQLQPLMMYQICSRKMAIRKSRNGYIKDTVETRLSIFDKLGFQKITLYQILSFGSQMTIKCNSQIISCLFHTLVCLVLIRSEIKFPTNLEILKLFFGFFIDTVMMVHIPHSSNINEVIKTIQFFKRSQ